jgi:hypothetical protein
MKRQGLALLASFALLATAAHADVVVFTAGSGEDFCSTLDKSPWSGKGTAVTDPIPILGRVTCNYGGDVEFSKVDAAGNFIAHINLRKTGGHWGCPKEEKLIKEGTCNSGVLTINKTPDAHFTGSVSNNTADLKGDVHFTLLGHDIKADVNDLHLQR